MKNLKLLTALFLFVSFVAKVNAQNWEKLVDGNLDNFVKLRDCLKII